VSEPDVSSPTVHLTGRLAPRQGWTAEGCPIAGAIDVVGARSAFLLLREAFYGTTRFADFAERVGISEPVAAARLGELVTDGLLQRTPYREPGQRTRSAYRLTDKGAAFFPVLAALMEWGDTWLPRAGVELQHHDCGSAVHTELRCGHGHRVEVGELDLVSRGVARRAARPATR
jgi:DNA-binding HxlR family transcriptional regulator